MESPLSSRQRKCESGCTCYKHQGQAFGGPSYQSRHKHTMAIRGKAREYICVACGGPAAEWAQIHDTDGTDPHQHYQPMCKKCHRGYDGWHEMIRDALRARWARIPVEKRNKSLEVRAKASEALRKRWAGRTPEERQEHGRKIAEGNKGRVQSAETREKIRKAAIGRSASPETREKMRISHTGKTWSPERRAAYEMRKRQEKGDVQ
jgi:hypothetical protein